GREIHLGECITGTEGKADPRIRQSVTAATRGDMMNRTAAILLLPLAVGGWVFSPGPVCPVEPPAAPVFVLHSATGRTARGPIQEIGPSWSVVLGGTTPATRVDSGDLVSLRRLDTVLPAPPTHSQFLFFNGDRLP